MPDAVMDKERVNLGDGRASYMERNPSGTPQDKDLSHDWVI